MTTTEYIKLVAKYAECCERENIVCSQAATLKENYEKNMPKDDSDNGVKIFEYIIDNLLMQIEKSQEKVNILEATLDTLKKMLPYIKGEEDLK